jgi:hypothetical protein
VGSLPLFEDFDQPDGTQLPPDWVEAFGDFVISSNALVSSFPGDSIALVNGINTVNVAVQATISLANTTTDANAGLMLHSTGALAFCTTECPSFYLGRIRKSGSMFIAEIVKNMDCTESTLASQEVASSDGTLVFAFVGGNLTLSLGGNNIGAANDSSIGPGTIGLSATGNGVSFDNFSGQ